jgi:hypothetical protein
VHFVKGDLVMPISMLLLLQDASGVALDTWLPLILPLAIIELVLIAVALVDLVRRDPRQVRGSKVVWVLVILLISTFGPICYLLLGRKEVADVHS